MAVPLALVLFGSGLVVIWLLFNKSKRTPPPTPESLVVVDLKDGMIICRRPDGKTERIDWADLKAVFIETSDQGPYLCDVFWVLVGNKGGCVVPQGAQNEAQLLERLQQLPGFNNGEVVKAMSSTSNARFLCWERGS